MIDAGHMTMKIERIEIHPLVGRLDEPFGWSQRWTDERTTQAIRIIADDGTYGWGETGIDPRALEGAAHSLIGENPERIGAIWQSIVNPNYQSGGYAGPASNIASAVDMALHDLVGRARGLPVYELLGGKVRDKICTYATGLYYVPSDLKDNTWADFRKEAWGYVEQGFSGMKMKIGGLKLNEDVDRVHALRREVGDNIRIMVDANEAYDPMTAIRVARRMADADVTWFEEPCSSRADEDNLLVTNRSPVPTSGGESANTRREVARLLRHRVFDIIQPEIANVGGISELKLSAAMAEACNVRFVPHFWNTGISFSAILHTLATVAQSPPARPKEPYVNEPVTEFDQTPHPIRASLTDPIFKQTDSHVSVPNTPGLGIEVDEDALNHFRQGEAIVVT